jgi:hypothetical protein
MLVQTASTKLCLSYRIHAILNLLSTESAKVGIPEKYKIYAQAHYGLAANGFVISVRPIDIHSYYPSYVLHVRCIDSEIDKSYEITWWIADCGDTEYDSVGCRPTTKHKVQIDQNGRIFMPNDGEPHIKYHMFDESEQPSVLSYNEILVAVAVIRNKLYRGALELDALYGVQQVMNE